MSLPAPTSISTNPNAHHRDGKRTLEVGGTPFGAAKLGMEVTSKLSLCAKVGADKLAVSSSSIPDVVSSFDSQLASLCFPGFPLGALANERGRGKRDGRRILLRLGWCGDEYGGVRWSEWWSCFLCC